MALALLLAGCGPSATERCEAINLAAVLHETWVDADTRIAQELDDSMTARATREAEASYARLGRVRTDEEIRATAAAGVAAQDSLWRRLKAAAKPGGDTLVSLAADSPPPTPSDLAWSAEHCWAGKSR